MPVYVYDDVDEQPWLPYHDYSGGLDAAGALDRVALAPAASGRLWQRVAVVLPISRFGAFLEEVLPFLSRNETWYRGKRAFAGAARDAYFTYEAVVRQIFWLFREPRPETADIKCAQPPRAFWGGAANAEQTWEELD